METLVRTETASSETEREIHLLLARDYTDDWRRWRLAGIWSTAFHVVLFIVLWLIPESPVTPLRPERLFVVHVTPLYTPTELTQKAPNKGKINKELTAEAIAPRPKVVAPAPAPSARAAQPPARFVPPPRQVAQAKQAPVVIEPPKIQGDAPLPPEIARLAPDTAPPPPPPAQQPKLTFENVAPPPAPRAPTQGKAGGVAIPSPSVDDAVRALERNGSRSGQAVGDLDVDLGPLGPGLNLPPSAGRPRSNLELKSDPMGVDFRPYLYQVLQAVRRNWFAVYPEAARLGQRGQVSLQFAIAKQGLVTKVIFSGESGAKALDQAAVAAISASNPLPPLPTEFKGDRVVLQMTFLYNMPRQ
jgi:TonB family protein